MSETRIVAIGPIDDAPPDRACMLAPLTGEISPETVVFAGDPVAGLEQLFAKLGHRNVVCEPALRGAAEALGLPVAELDIDDLELRADLALTITDPPDLPATRPPQLRRYLLQGLGFLRGSPTWRRFDNGSMGFATVEGRSPAGPCDVRATVTFGFAPSTHVHFVAEGPDPFDLRIFSEDRPSYVIEALSRAYALPFRPSLRVNEAVPPPGWLDRWGPAVGSALYLFSTLTEGELRKFMEVTSQSGVALKCQVEMLSTG